MVLPCQPIGRGRQRRWFSCAMARPGFRFSWCSGTARLRSWAARTYFRAARSMLQTAIRRYDTRFFMCGVPPGQTPVHDDSEATASRWISPAAALASADHGEMLLPPATWMTLRDLAQFTTGRDALAWARTRRVTRSEP